MRLVNYTLLGSLLVTGVAIAKPLSLYEKPSTVSHVVSEVDPAKGIVTVFQPKGSEWVKVANPLNGDVGWVKKAELNTANYQYQVIKQDNDAGKKKGPQSYRFVQYTGSEPYNAKELQKYFDNMHARQLALQKEMQHMVNSMFASMNTPMVMPVVLMPVKGDVAKQVKQASEKA